MFKDINTHMCTNANMSSETKESENATASLKDKDALRREGYTGQSRTTNIEKYYMTEQIGQCDVRSDSGISSCGSCRSPGVSSTSDISFESELETESDYALHYWHKEAQLYKTCTKASSRLRNVNYGNELETRLRRKKHHYLFNRQLSPNPIRSSSVIRQCRTQPDHHTPFGVSLPSSQSEDKKDTNMVTTKQENSMTDLDSKNEIKVIKVNRQFSPNPLRGSSAKRQCRELPDHYTPFGVSLPSLPSEGNQDAKMVTTKQENNMTDRDSKNEIKVIKAPDSATSSAVLNVQLEALIRYPQAEQNLVARERNSGKGTHIQSLKDKYMLRHRACIPRDYLTQTVKRKKLHQTTRRRLIKVAQECCKRTRIFKSGIIQHNSLNDLDDVIISPVIFLKVKPEDRNVVQCIVSAKTEEIPQLENAYRIVSKVCHLLPHCRKFETPLTMEIEYDKHLINNLSAVVLFYSATAPNEKPHWEMITQENESDPDRRILNVTPAYCRFSMPTFCLICAAEECTGQQPDAILLNQPAAFEIYVGLSFEAEHTLGRWLVKTRVLLSRNEFQAPMIAKAKIEVVRNSHLGNVRVQIYDTNDGWNLCESNSIWRDITVWQLRYGKRPEVAYYFYSDTATGMSIFNSRIRLHQENSRNDCETILEGSSLLNNMVKHYPSQLPVFETSSNTNEIATTAQASRRSIWRGMYGGANHIGVYQQNGAIDFPENEISTNSATAPRENSMCFLNGESSTFKAIGNSPMPGDLPNCFSESHMKNELASVIDSQSAEVLKSLCRHLGFNTDIDVIFRRALSRNVSPTFQLLEEWQRKTGGDKQKLTKAYWRYVN